MKKLFLLVSFLLLFSAFAKSQQDSSHFQVGVKTWSFYPWNFKRPISVFEPFRFSLEGQYLTNGNRWAFGYQYLTFNRLRNRNRRIAGFYGEGDFFNWNLSRDLRLCLPLRLYLVHDHYWEGTKRLADKAYLGFLSLGVDCQYRLASQWEISLTLGYLGYGTNLRGGEDIYGLFDGTGVSLYYRF